MLIEFQNGPPRKCIRIHALRSVWQIECGTGTRKNFHGACMVYLMRRFPTLPSVPLRHPPGNLGQIHKNKGLIAVDCGCVSVSNLRSNGMESSELLKIKSYRKPDAGKALRKV